MSEAKATDDDERRSRRCVSSNLISGVAIENVDVAQIGGTRYVRVSQVSEILRGPNCDRRVAGRRSVEILRGPNCDRRVAGRRSVVSFCF